MRHLPLVAAATCAALVFGTTVHAQTVTDAIAGVWPNGHA